jgi:hypothetical protein
LFYHHYKRIIDHLESMPQRLQYQYLEREREEGAGRESEDKGTDREKKERGE